ncbi:hypothetical protein [Fructilactobacillus cliffordii]|uniref:Uncharacterized protein n=1 Tax=Fructilactobacillus cliffordii TaxID=2940299 RepID=A0A9Q8ZS40_9LACO|nr:hypothetical protein [Fructilactobacillus cliffordii]USS88634.1 hypothetical protein M3M40_03800 [Fructilactobacillus cliffordii]
MEAEALAETLADFTADVLIEALRAADSLAEAELVPEPFIETEAERLLSVDILFDADSLADVLMLTSTLADCEALATLSLVEVEALTLLAEVLVEALVLSLATELLIDLAAESDVLFTAESLADLLIEAEALADTLVEVLLEAALSEALASLIDFELALVEAD